MLKPFYGMVSAAVGALGAIACAALVSGILDPKGAAMHWSVTSVSLDIFLIALFGLQHSLMARKSFKSLLGRVLSPDLERSTYVAASGAALLCVCLCWRPFGPMAWELEGVPAICLLGLQLLGWSLALAAVFSLDAAELMGFRQSGILVRKEQGFRTSWLHRRMRHPIYTGLLLAFFSVPQMSASQLLFALSMAFYVRIGIYFEERALLENFGEEYRAYMGRVPMLIPRLGTSPD